MKLILSISFIILLASCKKGNDGSNSNSTTQTKAPTAPIVDSIISVKKYIPYQNFSATIISKILSDGGSPITVAGICYGITPNPTLNDSVHYVVDASNSKGVAEKSWYGINSGISKLLPSTTYYARVFATNSIGTTYGKIVSFTTCAASPYNVGQNYQGGYIFYIDCSGQHGLIVAPVDQIQSISWGCKGLLIGAKDESVGSGSQNTTNIRSNCGQTYIAAYLTDTLTLGGYSDWFLPSKEELLQLASVNASLQLGMKGKYWTSTELSADWAIIVDIQKHQYYSELKNLSITQFPDQEKIGVRAIRAF